MLRKILIGGAMAVVFLGLVFLYFFYRNDTLEPARIAEAVPEDAVIFAHKIDYTYFTGDFRRENQFWRELTRNGDIARADSLIQQLSTSFNGSPLLLEMLEDQQLSLSLHLLGKDKLMPMFYLPLEEGMDKRDFRGIIGGILEKEDLVNERKYEAETLYDVSLHGDRLVDAFTYAIVKGVCILSPSSLLVESSIRSLNAGGNILQEPGFRSVHETAGRYVHANVYLNYRELDRLFVPFTHNRHWEKLQRLTRTASWSELDADFKEDALVFNGMTRAGDSLPTWLGMLEDQSPVRLESPSFMPSGTAWFLSLGVSEPERLFTRYREFLGSHEREDDFEREDDRLTGLFGSSPLQDILELMDDEIAWFTVDNNSGEGVDEVVMVESRSGSEARERLSGWIEQYASQQGVPVSRYTSEYVLDEQTRYPVYRLVVPLYEGFRAGTLFHSYFAFYDNYIYFADTKEALSRVIYQNVLHKTLVNTTGFGEVNEYLSSRSNVSVYLSPFEYLRWKKEELQPSFYRQVTELEEPLRKTAGVLMQFVSEDEMFYSHITLKYSSRIREKAMTVWESLLDSVAANKPTLVVNHYTQEKEILVQDKAHHLYLINSTGRILWKHPLTEPVMGAIYQVDYYDNGKLQYLFNTGSELHLLDRNGNYVERYPIRFRSRATNSIALFDYDNRGEHRIFVACEDRNIYLYDLEGNLVTGWKFRGSEGIVTKPVQHFRVEEKDYIVFSDPIRPYILNRRGRERVEPGRFFPVSKNNIFYLDMNVKEDHPRLVTTDSSGHVTAIDFNGEVQTILDHDATPGHFFRMQDMDHDGAPDYIFADGDELEVLDSGGEKLFSYRIKSDIILEPDIYRFSATDTKIGITDRERNEIHLVNADGTLYEGFPLEGMTPFSIGYFAGSDSRFNLIVGSANSFLYNYSIE